jgi:hypothetical protein
VEQVTGRADSGPPSEVSQGQAPGVLQEQPSKGLSIGGRGQSLWCPLMVSGLWFVALVVCPLLMEVVQPLIGCQLAAVVGLSNWLCLNLGLVFGSVMSKGHTWS